jgi:hypothetical protein
MTGPLSVLAVHRLAHRSATANVRINHHVDEERSTRLASTLKRRAILIGLRNVFAIFSHCGHDFIISGGFKQIGDYYDGVELCDGKPMQFRGETGAQSGIIPALDAVLGAAKA